MERLQKVIAASGITSRRKAERYIVEGSSTRKWRGCYSIRYSSKKR